MNKHIESTSESGFTVLTRSEYPMITSLSKEQISVGDELYFRSVNGALIKDIVKDVIECRPQVGTFINESKRRNWFKLEVEL